MVMVWWAGIGGGSVEEWPELMTSAEPVTRRRIARLHRDGDRAAVLVAHTLARACAATWLGVAFADVGVRRRCPCCGGVDHGRPVAVGIDGRRVALSISHTPELVAVAVDYEPVGVDVEPTGEPGFDWSELGARIFGAGERALLATDPGGALAHRWWVRKEALTKLVGAGLTIPLAEVEVHNVASDGGYVTGPAPGWVRDLPLAAGHVAALASLEPRAGAAREVTVDLLLRCVW